MEKKEQKHLPSSHRYCEQNKHANHFPCYRDILIFILYAYFMYEIACLRESHNQIYHYDHSSRLFTTLGTLVLCQRRKMIEIRYLATVRLYHYVMMG